jgi:membrane protein involved in colicin uptake
VERSWVRVSVAAATAPHKKAAAKSTSSMRCTQGSAMAPRPSGSSDGGANRSSPALSGATEESGDVTSGRGIYLQKQKLRPLHSGK